MKILILGKKEIKEEAKDKIIYDIECQDFKLTLDEIRSSDFIFYIDTSVVKILKMKYSVKNLQRNDIIFASIGDILKDFRVDEKDY